MQRLCKNAYKSEPDSGAGNSGSPSPPGIVGIRTCSARFDV